MTPARISSVVGTCGVWAAMSLTLLLATLAACKKKEVPSQGALEPEAKISTPAPRDVTVPKLGPVLPAQVTLKIGSSSGLRNPRGIGLDGSGNIYVADTGNYRVVKFDPSGKELLSFGQKGSAPGQFTRPWVLTVSSQGNVLVLDAETTLVQVFSPTGKLLSQMAGPDLAFYHPAGLAVAPDGTVLVVDTGGNRIVVIGPDGKPRPSLRSAGSESFSQPTDIYVDPLGGLHVYQTAEAKTPSVLFHLTPTGELERKWIAPDAPSTLDTPRAAIGGDGRVYVTDTQNEQIRVYDAGGAAYRPLRVEGADFTAFRLLSGIAVDRQGRVYALDAGANLVYRLQLAAPQ